MITSQSTSFAKQSLASRHYQAELGNEVSSNEPLALAFNIYNLLSRRQIDNPQNRTDLIFDLIQTENAKIKIGTENKICEMYFQVQPDGFFSEGHEFDEDIDNIISETSLSLAINGNKRSFPIEKLLRREPLLFSKRNLKEINNVNFVNSAGIEQQEIAILYGSVVDLDREDFLNDSLKKFDNNIISIKQIVDKRNKVIFKLKLKDRPTLVWLSSFGQGLNRYIAILCAIWASKDGFLLIDEVENGIHYTHYQKLWQIIFQASADANCQLFITSHSKECIEAFNEVQLEEQNNSGAYFEFYKNLKTDLITASKRDNEQLKYSLAHHGRVRGE